MKPCRRRRPSCSSGPDGHVPLRDYRDVVRDYLRCFQRTSTEEWEWYANQPDRETAIRVAALCKTESGRKHPHQWRLPLKSLELAFQKLKGCNFDSCKTFDELHDKVAHAIAKIHMIGPLAIYDIATRIGAFLAIQPDKVYLHRGTRVGARHLGFRGSRDCIEIDELPRPFHRLKPREIEDCLCIYKDALDEIRKSLNDEDC
jgi:hypothetical protein